MLINTDQSKNVPSNLSNFKGKVDKLDVDQLVPVPVDLSKLSDVVKNDVIKKYVYNTRIKNIEDKILDITDLATNASLNAKINEIKGKISNSTNLATNDFLNVKINEVKDNIPNIPKIPNLATITTLTAVENKVPNVSNLVKKTEL